MHTIIRLAVTALIVASLVSATAPSVLGRSQMALGVSQRQGSRDPDAVDEFNTLVGRKPASWTIWSTWGDPASDDFPSDMAKALIARGVTPMVWWEPMRNRRSCDYARHRTIANGRYDAYIKRWARAAKAVGGRVIVRWAQEINGAYFPWGVKGECDNTIRAYKDAWRHIVRLFRKVGATNVKFAWTVSNKPNCRPRPCNPYKPYFPGAKFIHYAGFSSFNWGAYNDTWVSMAEGIGPSYRRLRQVTTKPIIVIELATNTGSGDKPDWIRDGYPEVYARFPAVKAISYFNVDHRGVGHPDWSLNTPWPEAIQAYSEIVSQARFKGEY